MQVEVGVGVVFEVYDVVEYIGLLGCCGEFLERCLICLIGVQCSDEGCVVECWDFGYVVDQGYVLVKDWIVISFVQVLYCWQLLGIGLDIGVVQCFGQMGEVVDCWLVYDGIMLCGLKICNWSVYFFFDVKGFMMMIGLF